MLSHLRTEKEVEIKFIVPLLSKLGYSDDDRYDGMPIRAAYGSRATTLVIHFALFNAELESLRNQPLLTVEAKHEHGSSRQRKLQLRTTKQRATACGPDARFFIVTDSPLLQVST